MGLDRVVRHISKVRLYTDLVPTAWASLSYPQRSTSQSAGRMSLRNNRLTRHVQVHTVELP